MSRAKPDDYHRRPRVAHRPTRGAVRGPAAEKTASASRLRSPKNLPAGGHHWSTETTADEYARAKHGLAALPPLEEGTVWTRTAAMITRAMMARGKARAHTRQGAARPTVTRPIASPSSCVPARERQPGGGWLPDLASERGGPLSQSIDPPRGCDDGGGIYPCAERAQPLVPRCARCRPVSCRKECCEQTHDLDCRR
jgi:hypothetical protein